MSWTYLVSNDTRNVSQVGPNWNPRESGTIEWPSNVNHFGVSIWKTIYSYVRVRPSPYLSGKHTNQGQRQTTSFVLAIDIPITVDPDATEHIWKVTSSWTGHRNQPSFEALPEI